MRTAVVQRIEHIFDVKDGRRLESYQRSAHLVAPLFVAWGHFAFMTLRKYPPLVNSNPS
jgi:hypothetical protein